MRTYPRGIILEGMAYILANVNDANILLSQDPFEDAHVVMSVYTLRVAANAIPLDDTEMTLEEALDRLKAVLEEINGDVDEKVMAFLLRRGIIDKSELIKASNSLYPPIK